METITRAQLLDWTSLTRKQLDYLLKKGAIASVKGGGTGNYHRYDLMRVLALASAQRHLALGAEWSRAAGVARFLSGLSAEVLETNLADGKTLPIPATQLKDAAALAGLPDGLWMPGLLVAPPYDDPGQTPAARRLMKQLEIDTLYAELRQRFAALAPLETTAIEIEIRAG